MNNKIVILAQFIVAALFMTALPFAGFLQPVAKVADNSVVIMLGILGTVLIPLSFFANKRLSARLGGSITPQIVAFAMLEASATMGLVIFLLSGSTEWSSTLGSLSLLGMFLQWPRQ